MLLVAVALNGPPGAARSAPGELSDALVSAGTPGAGLEHVRLHPSRAGAVAVLFLREGPPSGSTAGTSALGRSRELCERALRSSPLLHGWTFGWCAELAPPLGDFCPPSSHIL